MTDNKIEGIPGLKDLWRETLGDTRVCIAVLDGPVDLAHQSLKEAKLNRIETLVQGKADQGAASKHGTHITSVIFGQHDGPIKGIAPNCRGLIVPIFRDGPNNSIAPCSQLDLARAIQQAVQEGAQIINISGGEFSQSGTAHPILLEAIRQATESGVLIIAAAGNDGCECLHVPGALPLVLPVGAMNWEGEPLDFSNWGENYQTKGILAPGENMQGAALGSGITLETGTSYAVPIVSGIAALLLSLQLKNEKKFDTKTVHTCLLDSAIGCDVWPIPDCRKLLRGRVNIPSTLTCLNNERPTTMIDADNKGSLRPLTNDNAPAQGVHSSTLKHDVPDDPEDNEVLTKNTAMNKTERRTELFRRDSPKSEGVVACGGCGGSPCSCGTKSQMQLAFPIGSLSLDFGTDTRRNYFLQTLGESLQNPMQMLEYFKTKDGAPDAASVLWILNIDTTPIYAIQPQGPFAREVYERLVEFLEEQLTKGVERVCIPGIVVGGALPLLSGEKVPVLIPELRGMCNWTTNALVEAVSGKPPTKSSKPHEQESYSQKVEAVRNFLDRVSHEKPNLGLSSGDRAKNYATTNALNVAKIFEAMLKDNMQLDTIEVYESSMPIQGKDCQEVVLTFFDPRRRLERARKVHRFNVDVSDIVPVLVGSVRSWDIH